MEKAKFDSAKELEDRILQLQLLKNYTEALLTSKPFMVEIKTTVLGQGSSLPSVPINDRHETLKHASIEASDKEYILAMIQARIDELQKQFEDL